MISIPVGTLIPTSGAAPGLGYDMVSSVGFLAWAVGDEARCSVITPDNHPLGADMDLSFYESSPSVAKRHAWRVETLLLRPGVHTGNAKTACEARTVDAVSPSTAHLVGLTSTPITGLTEPGRVGGTAVIAGDLLSVTLRRIEASADADPERIRLHHLRVTSRGLGEAPSPCPGRTGAIMLAVRDLFNESAGGFISDDFILRAINRCRETLAVEGYWRRESWAAVRSGVSRVNLLDEIADFQDLVSVRFSGADRPMTRFSSFGAFMEAEARNASPGTPTHYFERNGVLHIWPRPAEDAASGLEIRHSYLPPELSCRPGECDPPVPRGHDAVFTYFALRQAFLRDRHAAGADAKVREYTQMYEAEKLKLLGEGAPTAATLRGYR
jgi:hypothetical protein